MEILDVTSNYFVREEDVLPLLDIHRLMSLLIYGNPVLGPTGEDPMKIYIENLLDIAVEKRAGSHKRAIEVIAIFFT